MAAAVPRPDLHDAALRHPRRRRRADLHGDRARGGGRMTWPDWLAQQAALRDHAGLRRELRPRAADDASVDLAGNDYLGLSQHPVVRAAAAEAAVTWGAGAKASRLVTGALELHRDLESELAAYARRPASLLFSTGYAANLGVLQALAGRDAFVVSDAHVHASLVDAVRVSRTPLRGGGSQRLARGRRAPWHGPRDGARWCWWSRSTRCSATRRPCSTSPPCATTTARCWSSTRRTRWGSCAQGSSTASASRARTHVVGTATLSKAFGSQGGVVLASQAVIDQLVNTARSVHLRHRAGAGLHGRGPRSAGHRARPARAHATVELRVADLAAALGVPPPARRCPLAADAEPAVGRRGPGCGRGAGRPGRVLPPAVSA